MFNKNYVKKLLEENNISYKEKFKINDIEYDFLIGDNTVLNVVPFKESVFDEENGGLKDKKKDIEESNNVLNTEYECIHWYEHYDEKKMIDFLSSKSIEPENKLYARKLSVKEVEPKIAKDFIDDNHLLGLNKNGVYNLGLYKGDELVSCMSFSPVTNTKSNKKLFNTENLDNYWELIRFCSKTGYGVVGGANKLFNTFLKEKDPKGILTYSDYNLGKGSVYSKLGFKIAKKPGVNQYWSHPKDTKLFINDNLVRNGTDRIIPKYEDKFDFKYFKLGMDYNKFVENGGKEIWGKWWKEHKDTPLSASNWPGNQDNMLFYNFVRIFDCGYTTFIWEPS